MIMANSTNGTINNNANTAAADLQLSASSASSSQANTPSSSTSATTNASSTMTASTTANPTTPNKPPSNNQPSKSNAQTIITTTSATTNETNQEINTAINGNSNCSISSVVPSSAGPTTTNDDSRWIFSQEKIHNSPSRADNISLEDELKERQEAALFITDLGAALKVNQLCINTAIIYMHRFFMIHSFKKFHRYMIATSCLFFACKVEEQPRRLREFIDTIHRILHKVNEPLNPQSEEYQKCASEITTLESCLLQTLGFNVLINHAHTVIIKTCQMIKAPRDLAEAAYLTATNSLVLTNFCVKFSAEKVACFCIYLACKWTGIKIPTSSEGLQWYQYVKDDIVEQELEDISKEYLSIYDKCPPKIQKKLGKTKHADESQMHQQLAAQVQKSQKPNQTHPLQQQHKKLPDNKHITGAHQQQIVNISHTNKPTSAQTHSHHPSKPIQNGSGGPTQNPHQHHPPFSNKQLPQQQHQRPLNSNNNNGQNINNKLQSTSKDTNQMKQQFLNNNNNNKNTSMPPSSTNTNPLNTNSSNLNKSNGSIQTGVSSQSRPLNQTTSLSNLTSASTNDTSSSSSSSNDPAINKSTSSQNLVNKKTQPPSSSASSSPSQPTSTSTSMKRVNEDLNNLQSAPNKIPKYVIDQKSVNI
jgi:cyclin T